MVITSGAIKIRDSHLICKVANKYLNVWEWVEVAEWNKRWSPTFLCCPVNGQFLWKKNLIEKKIDSEYVYNEKILNIKIKSSGDRVTDFYNQELPKVDSNHTYLAVISLDSALKKDENYYLQVFLKACKYVEKKWLDIWLFWESFFF